MPAARARERARPDVARRRAVALMTILLMVVGALLLAGGDDDTGRAAGARGAATAAASPSAALPTAEAVGQVLVGRYAGRTPSAGFRQRVRDGRVGSVILFADNTAGGVTGTRRAIDRLQAAAKAGGRPPLLVMIDQEGGLVKRLPGPPDRAAAAMGSAAVARDQGAATGRMLRRAGVNFDLAPVVDIPRVRGSFLGTRAFSRDPLRVAQRACAFAAGLRSEGVAAALKHFPGLGRARGNTDDGRITVTDTAAAIRSDWGPYERCAGATRTAVMMSSATYPRLLGADAPAVLARAAYTRDLPQAGVPTRALTISDDLDAGAMDGRARVPQRALAAGLDLLLFAAGEATSARAHAAILADVRSGAIPRSRLRDAGDAVLALKASLP